MAQNQNKQNNEKGFFLLLILLCHIKREAKTLKLFYSKWRLHACATFENFLMTCKYIEDAVKGLAGVFLAYGISI